MNELNDVFEARSIKNDDDRCAACGNKLGFNLLKVGNGYFADLHVTTNRPYVVRLLMCEDCMIKIVDFYNKRERERNDINQNSIWLGGKHDL